MSGPMSPLDGCACCTGLVQPDAVRNDPGLPALRYRVDTQPGFHARMLQSLPLARADAKRADSPKPLAALLSRSSDDPSVALLDACACMADVLTFYQERIANEGFLRTATERRSVLELARAVGYELKPGVAASVYLAFTVEDAPGSPGVCTIAKGSPLQSVPAHGKLPQVFETSAELVARAEWNSLSPRQVRPADMAVLGEPPAGLGLLGARGSFPASTAGLRTDLSSAGLFRLDPGPPADARVDAIPVSRIYISEATTGINGGDLLLFTGKSGTALRKLVMRAVAVVPEPALRRLRVDLEPLPDPARPAPPPAVFCYVPAVTYQKLNYAQAQVETELLTRSTLFSTVAGQAWRERDLQAMIGIQGWNAQSLVQALAQPSNAPPVAPEVGAFAFRAKLGFFGNNAPKWAILPDGSSTNGRAYPLGWDQGDQPPSAAASSGLGEPRTIWTDSQGQANPNPPHAYLERAVPELNRGSWLIIDAPEAMAEAYPVFDARETSRADYGLSGRAMALTLADANGTVLGTVPSTKFHFRSATAYAASRKLELANLPIEAPVAAGDTTVELDRMVLGLTPGQPVALAGERDDLPGVAAAEIVELSDIVHADGRSTLLLRRGLVHSYRRSSLRMNANVVPATHGETVVEVLGNGDASLPNQSFVLKKPPTTFVSAGNARGSQSSLEVRINGVRWDEVPSLYKAVPQQTVYATRIDDDARMQIIFGDGVQGARLPTGTVNVAARYRSGIGPDGEVDADTLTMLRSRPLGLRGVSNPLPASGAEGPEQLADARRNAPLTLLTFERVVSPLDYENYARAYPGIGKARGDLLWIDGAARMVLTVAGATGGLPGPDVLANLAASVGRASDPAQRFSAVAYMQRYFSCSGAVAVDPRYLPADVLDAVRAALQSAFGFDAREIAQSVTASEVVSLMQGVAGVLAVDLDSLQAYPAQPSSAGARPSAVPAFAARWDPARRQLTAAELLLVNPSAISLREMPA